MEHNAEIRINKLETRVEGIEKKIDDISGIKDAVIKLALLSEQQTEKNKKFDALCEMVVVSNTEFSSTLKTIGQSLISMNEELKKTNDRISNLESKVDIKFNCIDSKSKIDLLSMVKKWVPAIFVGGISFWILQLVGVIKM